MTTTKKLIASQYDWYYQACRECPKVARGEKAPFMYESGHSTEAEIFRYHTWTFHRHNKVVFNYLCTIDC